MSCLDSPTDRRSIGSLAAPLSLAIENDRLRRGPDPASTGPAGECRACSRLHASGATQCACGGALVEAAVPHVLRGVFQLEKRIGAGGMGVVYRAVDLSLKRPVAIKTLPRLKQDQGAQLMREAQAMASLNHVNLAVIYGIEFWRATPFLVEEYLAGGTLADRLRRDPLPVAEALDLCGHAGGRRRPAARGRHHSLRHQVEQHRVLPDWRLEAARFRHRVPAARCGRCRDPSDHDACRRARRALPDRHAPGDHRHSRLHVAGGRTGRRTITELRFVGALRRPFRSHRGRASVQRTDR